MSFQKHHAFQNTSYIKLFKSYLGVQSEKGLVFRSWG